MVSPHTNAWFIKQSDYHYLIIIKSYYVILSNIIDKDICKWCTLQIVFVFEDIRKQDIHIFLLSTLFFKKRNNDGLEIGLD